MRNQGLAFPLTLLAAATCIGTGSAAGPLPIVCIRDQDDDPKKIKALFGQIDRKEVANLEAANVSFYVADRGFVAVEEIVPLLNYRDGREDAAPLYVSGIRPLEDKRRAGSADSYVVQISRSAWFDRGSDINNSYTKIDDFWLVSFSGCEIKTVREVPELSYMIDSTDK
ncbi:MAG TPA: hypothetical protein VGD23_11110 [Sphingomicrobium sp.]